MPGPLGNHIGPFGMPTAHPDNETKWIRYFVERGFTPQEAAANAAHILSQRRWGNEIPESQYPSKVALEQSGGPAGPRLQEQVYGKPQVDPQVAMYDAWKTIDDVGSMTQRLTKDVTDRESAARKAASDERFNGAIAEAKAAASPSRFEAAQKAGTKAPRVAEPMRGPTPEGQDAGRDELARLADIALQDKNVANWFYDNIDSRERQTDRGNQNAKNVYRKLEPGLKLADQIGEGMSPEWRAGHTTQSKLNMIAKAMAAVAEGFPEKDPPRTLKEEPRKKKDR